MHGTKHGWMIKHWWKRWNVMFWLWVDILAYEHKTKILAWKLRTRPDQKSVKRIFGSYGECICEDKC